MIRCELNDLKDAISLTSLVEIKSSHAILNHSKIEKIAEENKIGIYATDLEIGLKILIPAEECDSESFCINTKKATELISKLIPCPICLDFNGKQTKIFSTEKTVKTKINLQSLPVTDFPEIPVPPKNASIIISSEILLSALKKVMYAMSDNAQHFFLNGVHFDVKNGDLTVVATDSRRLALYVVEGFEEKINFSVTVPSKTINLLTKIFKEDVPLSISVVENLIFFESEKIILSSNLLNGNFPNYQQLLIKEKREKEITIEVNREEMISKVDRISPLAFKVINQIKVQLTESDIKLYARNEEGDINEELSYEEKSDKVAEEINIGFNYMYILDVLKNSIESDKCFFRIVDGKNSIVIQTEEDLNFYGLIMPMKLNY